MKKSLIILGAILLVVIAAGMYKFNYLAGLPGYDVDGNPLKTSPNFEKAEDQECTNPSPAKKKKW